MNDVTGLGQRFGNGVAAGADGAVDGRNGVPKAVQGVFRLFRDSVPESHRGGAGA